VAIYARYVLPRIIHLACGVGPIQQQRAAIVPRAAGTVVEVGIGSGHTLAHYDPSRIDRLIGVDPSKELCARARQASRDLPFEVELVEGVAEKLPVAEGSADAVVVTYALCSVEDPLGALREMRRVLTPGGALLFCEHGAAPEARVRRRQDRMTPVWRRLGGGCHLNREIAALVEAAGFRIDELETGYLPGWKPASYHYRGAAVRV
jgi:ubiquinone/menaquinone biosynthesis C-methylase UbiE